MQSTERPQASCPQAPATWQRLESGRCNLVTTDDLIDSFLLLLFLNVLSLRTVTLPTQELYPLLTHSDLLHFLFSSEVNKHP